MANKFGYKRWLRNSGFRPVLGMYEYVGGAPETIVKRVPLTWATYNGLTVFYDRKGNPWVKAGVLQAHNMPRRATGLRPGGYVPFSDDPLVFTSRRWGRHSSERTRR